MAVPTITDISPDTGHPGGGQMIEITGTNFREQPSTPSVPPHAYKSVAVTVDGVAAEEVLVVSSTLLRVRVPDYRGDPNPELPGTVDESVSRVTFPAVDIVVTNLDDDGDPIGGETVTEASAFSYVQPLIRAPAGDPPLYQVFREFLWLLKRQVVSRVARATHTDFGDSGEKITVLSKHPSIGLQMNLLRDPEYSYFDNETILVDNGDNTWSEYDASKTFMMMCPMTLSSQSETEVHHMVDALIDAHMATPWLNVQPDPSWPPGALNRYPLEMVDMPTQVGTVDRANIHAFAATMRIRGIPLVREDPLTTTIRRRMTISLGTTDVDGNDLTIGEI